MGTSINNINCITFACATIRDDKPEGREREKWKTIATYCLITVLLIKFFKCLFASATHAWLSSSLTIYSPSWILINALRFSFPRFTRIMTRIIANSSRSLFIKKTTELSLSKFPKQICQEVRNQIIFLFFTDFCDNLQSIEWIWQFNFLENYRRSCYSSIIPHSFDVETFFRSYPPASCRSLRNNSH